MALDPDTTKKVIAHITKKWAAGVCPMCRTQHWELSGHVTLFLSDNVGSGSIGGPALPCVAAVCQNCGNTVLVNLVAAGIVGKNG